MTDKMRVPEGTLCDHCHDPKKPLNEANSAHLFQRNLEGKEITKANVHKECADAWAHANGGSVVQDEPAAAKTASVTSLQRATRQ